MATESKRIYLDTNILAYFANKFTVKKLSRDIAFNNASTNMKFHYRC